MICEVLPEIIDCEGTRTSKPKWKKHWFVNPTYPLGFFIKAKVAQRCDSIEEIRSFLRTCTYVSDEEQFNKEDYWLSPDRFEKLRKGDCEDFSLWTWRQLMQLGYETRLAVGRMGDLGGGHVWVAYKDAGKWFFLEATAAWRKRPYPRLWCRRYQPEISIQWNGKKLEYYEHQPNTFNLTLKQLLTFGPGYACFRVLLLASWVSYLPLRLLRGAKRTFKRHTATDQSSSKQE